VSWLTQLVNGAATLADRAPGDSGLSAMSRAVTPLYESTWSTHGLGGTPYPFQTAGVDYILQTRRCLVADQMGLGKSFTSLAAVHVAGAFPCLIVCPASLKLTWVREVRRRLSGHSVCTDTGTVDVTITNYERLHKLEWRPWRALICDEAHMLANAKAQRTQRILKLSHYPSLDLVLLLTGTPIVNRPLDLASLLDILGRLHDYGGLWGFARQFCDPRPSTWGWDLSGSANLAGLNSRLRKTCLLRRTKADWSCIGFVDG